MREKLNIQELSNEINTPPARVSINNAQTVYYRSKLFSVNAYVNPLVSAAAPLLVIASQLKNLTITPDLAVLYQDLIHEVKAFETKTQAQGYRTYAILAARYALCAMLDEIVLTIIGTSQNSWQYQNLLNTFQQNTSEDERFFIILERSCQDPALHIDLLELLYLCLSLGFEGKYREMHRGHAELAEITDKLYKIIRQERGEPAVKLSVQSTKQTVTKTPSWVLPVSIIVVLTLAILITLYSSFNFYLNKKTAAIYEELTQLQSLHIQGVNG